MTEEKLFEFQRKSISLMKQKHLENINIMREVILSAYEEYGWH